MVANVGALPNYDDILRSFVDGCYPSCLELEETAPDEYLECKVTVERNEIKMKHWNKNECSINTHGKQYYFKQQHFHSYTSNHSKRGALIGTWTRMQDNSNDDDNLHMSIMEKMKELRLLEYTDRYVNRTLRYMAKKTKSNVWLRHAPHLTYKK